MHASRTEALAAAVLRRASDGEDVSDDERRSALATLNTAVAREQLAVYTLCRHVVGDPQRAADLGQEALVVALQRVHTFAGEGSFRSWMLGIARFTALRAMSRKADLLHEDGVFETADPARSALALLRRQAREDLIRDASAALEPVEQEAIYLRYVEGLGQDEITRILELENASGARGLLVRCRRKLRREIEDRLARLGHGMSFFDTGENGE